MAEQTVVATSVTEALIVNAGGASVATPSLSSSSSCISSSSPTSSFGSGGGSGAVSEIQTSIQQVAQQTETLKRLDSENADDSTNNVNSATNTTPSTGNNCNSSGEPVSSDGDHRGSAEDIISHLNMLSMQDGLGFNGFGLLGTGNGGANAWTAAGMPSNLSSIGNGMNKQGGNIAPIQDQQQLGVANYIEALKIQQQLQLQQLKSSGLSGDMIANFFTSSPAVTAAPNFFGGSIMQNPNFRRPIFGAGGTGSENLYGSGPYGNIFMNRPTPGIHYPPPMDFGGQGRAVYKRPSSSLKHPETASVSSSIPSHTPSSVVMIPSNVTFTSLIPPANTTISAHTGHQRGRSSSTTARSATEVFSRKVFVGGLPMDISEEEICLTFMRFGSVTVDWPHKAESKSYFPPKGYAFLIFHSESSVQALIDCCIQQDGRYYMCVSSPTMREKAVQIRPWRLADADFVLDSSLPLDPRKTVFVGGVPRPLKAVELASILERLFGGVCYTGIDTDPELKYPKGAGRVSFSNQQSYIAAISARFVQLQHGDIDKRVEIKPYVLDDQMCDECGGSRCGGKYAPYFCANVGCLQYYCELCWQHIHSKAGREFHKPLVKEGTDRPRAVPFKWGM